jgi:hypothetical protein
MIGSLDDDQRQQLSDLLQQCLTAFDEPSDARRPTG